MVVLGQVGREIGGVLAGQGGSTSGEEIIDDVIVWVWMVLLLMSISGLFKLALGTGQSSLEAISSR